MDAMPRVSVVTIADDGSGFEINGCGPLPAVGGDGYNQIIQVFSRPAITKATGIATFQQYGKGVIGDIPGVAAFINSTCCQVDTFQLSKGYGNHDISCSFEPGQRQLVMPMPILVKIRSTKF